MSNRRSVAFALLASTLGACGSSPPSAADAGAADAGAADAASGPCCQLSARQRAFFKRVAFQHLKTHVETDSTQSRPGSDWSYNYAMLYFPDSGSLLIELYEPLDVGDSVVPPCASGFWPRGVYTQFSDAEACRRLNYVDGDRVDVSLGVRFATPASYEIEDLPDTGGALPDDDWLGTAHFSGSSYSARVRARDTGGVAVTSVVESEFQFAPRDGSETLAATIVSQTESQIPSAGTIDAVEWTFTLDALVSQPLTLSASIAESGDLSGVVQTGDGTTLATVTGSLASAAIEEQFSAFAIDWK